MTNNITDALYSLEKTRAALRTLTEMTAALMSQGDSLETFAWGFAVIMDEQEERLEEIEDAFRAERAETRRLFENNEHSADKPVPVIQPQEASFELRAARSDFFALQMDFIAAKLKENLDIETIAGAMLLAPSAVRGFIEAMPKEDDSEVKRVSKTLQGGGKKTAKPDEREENVA